MRPEQRIWYMFQGAFTLNTGAWNDGPPGRITGLLMVSPHHAALTLTFGPHSFAIYNEDLYLEYGYTPENITEPRWSILLYIYLVMKTAINIGKRIFRVFDSWNYRKRRGEWISRCHTPRDSISYAKAILKAVLDLFKISQRWWVHNFSC